MNWLHACFSTIKSFLLGHMGEIEPRRPLHGSSQESRGTRSWLDAWQAGPELGGSPRQIPPPPPAGMVSCTHQSWAANRSWRQASLLPPLALSLWLLLQ